MSVGCLLRNQFIEQRILQGGVANPDSITPGFGAQGRASGLRSGHYRAFLNLLRHAHKWDELKQSGRGKDLRPLNSILLWPHCYMSSISGMIL